MKKILLSVTAILLTTSICFAQTAMMPKPSILMGVVKSVAMADVAKGTKAQIVITDLKGMDMTLVVSPKTVFAHYDGKPAAFNNVARGLKIAVRYATVAGENEAIAVKING